MQFSDATLAILMRTLVPVADMFTNGGGTLALDEIGDRGEAIEILGTEIAELGGAIKTAARNGATEAQIAAVIQQAKDVPEALKLLKSPSVAVTLDGEQKDADDDTETPGAGE